MAHTTGAVNPVRPSQLVDYTDHTTGNVNPVRPSQLVDYTDHNTGAVNPVRPSQLVDYTDHWTLFTAFDRVTIAGMYYYSLMFEL